MRETAITDVAVAVAVRFPGSVQQESLRNMAHRRAPPAVEISDIRASLVGERIAAAAALLQRGFSHQRQASDRGGDSSQLGSRRARLRSRRILRNRKLHQAVRNLPSKPDALHVHDVAARADRGPFKQLRIARAKRKNETESAQSGSERELSESRRRSRAVCELVVGGCVTHLSEPHRTVRAG